MGNKKAVDLSRGPSMFWALPEQLTIPPKGHRLFDPRGALPPDEALVRSFVRYGYDLAPLLIHPEDDVIYLIDGRRRVTALAEANKRLAADGLEPVKALCVAKTTGDEAKLVGMMIGANELGLDDTPLARAKKAQQFMELGRNEDEAADRFGVTKSAIKGWIRLLELPAVVRNAVDAGKISATAAGHLHDLPAAEAADAVERLVAGAATIVPLPDEELLERLNLTHLALRQIQDELPRAIERSKTFLELLG